MRLMITRPQQDAALLATRLRTLGHDALLEPLLEICFKPNMTVNLTGIAAILATSANGARALAQATRRRDLPLLAVGHATARAAEDVGFRRVISAGGDMLSLAEKAAQTLDPGAGDLLHAAGTRLAGDLQGLLSERGFEVRRVVLYDARTAQQLSPPGADALRAGTIDGVLLFSPRTARTFVELAVQAGVGSACGKVTAYCLSAAVAQAAAGRPDDLNWRDIRQAIRPEEGPLLELLETAP